MQHVRNLQIWQKSHDLVLKVYEASRSYPREELFGVTSQTRRAAVSIPANIAEGCGRGTDPEFKRFLSIAMGSANELEYHLLLARDLGYLETEWHAKLDHSLVEIKRMMTALIQRLAASKD